MSDSPIPQVTPRAMAAAIAVTAIVTGAVYGLTLAPTVTGEDSGELIAAAYTLGIPHPPGYPIWCLAAHAVIKLIPYGEVAWRANLVSALFGVLTACTVTAIVMRLTTSFMAGVTGGLSYAFSHEVWGQSVLAEVYTQYAFFFALTLYFVLRWRDTAMPKMMYGAAFTAGLGVVAHGLMILSLPVFALAVLWPRDHEWPTLKHVGIGVAAFLAPFLVLLYLPIRSAADPAMDWGDPETVGAFWDVMTRAQYESLFVGSERSLGAFLDQLGFFWREFYSTQVMGIVFAGTIMAFNFRRATSVFLILLFGSAVFGSILLTNFPIALPDTWLNTRYWIPAYVVCGVWAGCIVGFFRTRIPNVFVCALAVLGSALFLTAVPIKVNAPGAMERAENRYEHEYAGNVLMTLPENAVYIGGGDHTIFPVLYMQIVEGQRRDVTVVNPYGYIDMARVEGLRDAFPAEAREVMPSEASEPLMVEWIASHTGRPVYSANPLMLEGFRSVRHGVLYRIAPPEDVLADPYSIWSAYAFAERPLLNDWTSRLMQFDYFAAAAERDIAKGDRNKAEIYLLSASTFASWDDHYGGGNQHAFNNIAILAARAGLPDLAEEFWLNALHIDPEFELARRNLEKFRARRDESN